MQDCCVDALKRIQDLEEARNQMTFLLKASPYIILFPSLGSGVLNEGVRQWAAKQIAETFVTEAVKKVTAAGKLPSVADGVKAAGIILLGKIQGEVFMQEARHSAAPEGKFWTMLHTIYTPPGGGIWW